MDTSADAAYCMIYQVLDALRDTAPIPAAKRGQMFLALDILRSCDVPSDHVTKAEAISVAIHKWELARRRHDDDREQTIKAELAALKSDWLDMPLPNPVAVAG